jgi:hypothetical protein
MILYYVGSKGGNIGMRLKDVRETSIIFNFDNVFRLAFSKT